jgi:hypothetical protein
LDFFTTFKSREHDNTGFRKLGSDCDQRLNATQIRHTKIHERNIGPMLTILLNRILPAGGL